MQDICTNSLELYFGYGKFQRKNIPKLISSNDATEKVWIRLTGLNDIFTSCETACPLLIHATRWNLLGQDLSLSQIFMQNLTIFFPVLVPFDPLLTLGHLMVSGHHFMNFYKCFWISNS